MADAAQVRDAIAGVAAAACYPDGAPDYLTTGGGAVLATGAGAQLCLSLGGPTVTGAAIRVYGGYPNAQQLDADLRNGICHVGVDLRRGATKAVPVSLSGPEIISGAPPTMSCAGARCRLTLYGTASAGQTITACVDGIAFAYTQGAADTLESTAAQLAALIAASYPLARSAGATLIVPQARRLTAGISLGALATTTWSVRGNALTLAGTAAVGQAVLAIVDGMAFGTIQSASDTPATTAAALAALIAAFFYPSASALGATVTVPGCHSLAAAVAAAGSTVLPVHRQTQEFVVTVYAAGFANREIIGPAIDVALAGAKRIVLPDGTIGSLRLTWVNHDDRPEKELLFVRQRGVQVEYDTVVPGTATQIGAFALNVLGGPAALQGEGIFVQGGTQIPAARILLSADGNFLAGDDSGNVIGTA
jgi:hypothetical protein